MKNSDNTTCTAEGFEGFETGTARNLGADRTQQLEIDLESLMDRYSDIFLRMAALMLKDLKLAEDAVQETFIRFYTSRDNYRGEAAIKTYMSKILVNTCRQKCRTAWFRRNVPIAEADWYAGAEDYAFQSANERICLTQALAELDAASREVLLLHYYNDLSVKEISQVLNRPEGTIKSRLKRGRDRLGRILQEDFNDE